MTLPHLHRLSLQCADRLRGFATVARALEDGIGSERDVIAYRQSALGGLTSLVCALREAKGLPGDVASTAAVLLADAETSAGCIAAGIVGPEKIGRIAAVVALLGKALEWQMAESKEVRAAC